MLTAILIALACFVIVVTVMAYACCVVAGRSDEGISE